MIYQPQDIQGTYDKRGYLSRDQREATTVRIRKDGHPDVGVLAPPLVKGGQGRELEGHELGSLWIGLFLAIAGILSFVAAYLGR